MNQRETTMTSTSNDSDHRPRFGPGSNLDTWRAELRRHTFEPSLSSASPAMNDPGSFFPSASGAQEANQEKKSLAQFEKKPKILIVEDNWDHATLAMRTLTQTGLYEVAVASSGSEALNKLSKEEFSLMLVDYSLFGMTGLGLMKKIKEENQMIPTVMITGLGSEAVAIEAMKLGAYDYVIKSGDYLRTLPQVVMKALERFQLKRVKEQWDQWILKRNHELSALNAIVTEVGRSLNLQDVLRRGLKTSVRVLGAEYGEIGLLEGNENTYACLEAFPSTLTAGILLSSETVKELVTKGRPLIIEDTTQLSDAHWATPSRNIKSISYIPLRSQNQILGIMALGSRKKFHFTLEDVMLLGAVGSEIGAAIRNATLYEEIRNQAERIKADLEEQKRLQDQLLRTEKLASIGQFVAGIAHELNNALTGISGFTQILIKEGRGNQETLDLLEKIQSEAIRSTHVIRSLLLFAREGKLKQAYISVNELLERTLTLRAYKLETEDIELRKELDPNLPWTFADPLQLQLTFLNIIINSEQAMINGTRKGKLEVRTRVRENSSTPESEWARFIEVVVTDNGPGISNDNLQKVFDPFFTTKEIGDGTGLGLAMAYGIVKKHGGDIEVASEMGSGTTFTVLLPIKQEQSLSKEKK